MRSIFYMHVVTKTQLDEYKKYNDIALKQVILHISLYPFISVRTIIALFQKKTYI